MAAQAAVLGEQMDSGKCGIPYTQPTYIS